jgi:hypothetical protein
MKKGYTEINPKALASAIFLCLLALTVSASRFESRLYVDGIFDNHAYGSGYPVTFEDRTHLYARVHPEFGFRIAGSHKIRSVIICDLEPQGGLHIYTTYGFYYHYDTERLRLRLGSFPRKVLDIPVWFFSKDSRLVILGGGAAIEINHQDFTAGAWVDNKPRHDNVNRPWHNSYVKKQFSFGAKLGYNPSSIFFTRGDFIMTHHYSYPWFRNFPHHSYVEDNGGVSFEAGAAWEKTAFSDTLRVSAGAIMGLYRYEYRYEGADIFWYPPDGGNNIWRTPGGGFVNAFAAKGILGMRSFLYIGEPQRMWYGNDQWAWHWNARQWRYNPATYIQTYSRLDWLARLHLKENVRAEFTTAFHLLHNTRKDPDLRTYKGTTTLGQSQHFLLRAEFGGS